MTTTALHTPADVVAAAAFPAQSACRLGGQGLVVQCVDVTAPGWQTDLGKARI
jgi:hypothetical protein